MSVSYFDGADYTVEDDDYDGNVRLEGAYIEDIAEDPAYVNISAGEKLALVLPYDPYVRMYEGSCIGYGHYEKSDELTGYEEIAGVDLSDVETIADANERLAGTDLRFYTCTRSSHYDDVLLLSSTRGMQVTAGTYVGTAFEEETYSFDRAFYLFTVTSMQKPEIEKRVHRVGELLAADLLHLAQVLVDLGLDFIVDLSDMAPGTYYLDVAAGDAYSGQETFIIEIA